MRREEIIDEYGKVTYEAYLTCRCKRYTEIKTNVPLNTLKTHMLICEEEPKFGSITYQNIWTCWGCGFNIDPGHLSQCCCNICLGVKSHYDCVVGHVWNYKDLYKGDYKQQYEDLMINQGNELEPLIKHLGTYTESIHIAEKYECMSEEEQRLMITRGNACIDKDWKYRDK